MRARCRAAAGMLMLVSISCGAEESAPPAQQAPEESPPTELGPIIVTPRHDNDPLFEADRKLHDLLNGTPCLGCDAAKPKEGTVKRIAKAVGKAALDAVLPQAPTPRETDPQSRAEEQSTRRVDREDWDRTRP